MIGHLLLVIGAALLTLAGWTGSIAAFAVACCAAGLGQGLCFRAGLSIVSGRSLPQEHARIAAIYAASSYLATAILVPLLGQAATAAGFGAAFLLATTGFLTMATTTLWRRTAEREHHAH